LAPLNVCASAEAIQHEGDRLSGRVCILRWAGGMRSSTARVSVQVRRMEKGITVPADARTVRHLRAELTHLKASNSSLRTENSQLQEAATVRRCPHLLPYCMHLRTRRCHAHRAVVTRGRV
jgi:hypothetical protein